METLEHGKRESQWGQRVPAVFAGAALIIGLAGHALAIWAACQLLDAPVGITIRPMDVSVAILFAAVAAFVLGLPCAFFAIVGGWRRPGIWVAGLLAAVLCLTPLLSGRIAWNVIVAERGLTLGD